MYTYIYIFLEQRLHLGVLTCVRRFWDLVAAYPDSKSNKNNVVLFIQMANAIKPKLFFSYPDGKRNKTIVFFAIRMANAIKPMHFVLSGWQTQSNQYSSCLSGLQTQ